MKIKTYLLCAMLLTVPVTSIGCTALWFAGGAAAGYGVAKDAEDGEIIDSEENLTDSDQR